MVPRSLQKQIRDAIALKELTYVKVADRMIEAGRPVSAAIVGQWANKKGKAERMERDNLEALIGILELNRTEAWIAALDLDVEPPAISDSARDVATRYDTLSRINQMTLENVLDGLTLMDDPGRKDAMARIEARQRETRPKRP